MITGSIIPGAIVVVPLRAVPNQAVNVNLGGQNCTIVLYQRDPGLFCNLYRNNALVIGGVICQAYNPIVRDDYLGFIGDVFFADTQGNEDPYYTGLGSRFALCYRRIVS